MTRRFPLILATLLVASALAAAGDADEAAKKQAGRPAPGKKVDSIWKANCDVVADYHQKLIFTVTLVKPKVTATNRKRLLALLDRLQLSDVKRLGMKRKRVVKAVKAAPRFKDQFGNSDMQIPRKLDKMLTDLLAAVSVEAKKRGVECGDFSGSRKSVLDNLAK